MNEPNRTRMRRAGLQAQEDNGWVPIIDGKVNFPDDKGSTDIMSTGRMSSAT
jgi:hypothetical protein